MSDDSECVRNSSIVHYICGQMKNEKKIIMLGTKAEACGGIASVITQYEIKGLFERQPINYLPTRGTGSRRAKYKLFLTAVFQMVKLMRPRRAAIVHTRVTCDTSFWRKAPLIIFAHAAKRTHNCQN